MGELKLSDTWESGTASPARTKRTTPRAAAGLGVVALLLAVFAAWTVMRIDTLGSQISALQQTQASNDLPQQLEGLKQEVAGITADYASSGSFASVRSDMSALEDKVAALAVVAAANSGGSASASDVRDLQRQISNIQYCLDGLEKAIVMGYDPLPCYVI
jgi:hypothetical protein